MMQKVRAWLDAVLDRAERHPRIAPVLQLADENIVLGVVAGGVLFLLIGLIGGAANRGFAGLLVGGICGALFGAAAGGGFTVPRMRPSDELNIFEGLPVTGFFDLVLVFKTIAMMEGIGLQLDPELNIFDEVEPYVREVLLELESPVARLKELAEQMRESSQAAMQMVAGGRQQATGIEQIALAMKNINQATAQGLASTRQTESAARDLSELAQHLASTVEEHRL